jgi:hypothetical protein
MRIEKFSYRFYPTLATSQSGNLGQFYAIDDRNSTISATGITASEML